MTEINDRNIRLPKTSTPGSQSASARNVQISGDSNGNFTVSGGIKIGANDICLLVGTGTPTDGGSGTGANIAGKGSLHLNTSDGKLRTNTNTKASPTWTVVGGQS